MREVPLAKVLIHYGYDIVETDREQQFSCGIHGVDVQKSARFFPQSNSTYCWTCHKSRDAIEYVREKENVKFSEALDLLERWFKLPPLPWVDEIPTRDEEDDIPPLPSNEGVDSLRDKSQGLLMWITKDQTLSMETCLQLWEAFDTLAHLPEKHQREGYRRLHGKIMTSLKA